VDLHRDGDDQRWSNSLDLMGRRGRRLIARSQVGLILGTLTAYPAMRFLASRGNRVAV